MPHRPPLALSSAARGRQRTVTDKKPAVESAEHSPTIIRQPSSSPPSSTPPQNLITHSPFEAAVEASDYTLIDLN